MKASVGICAHNEEETIGKLIDQIMEEQVPVRQVVVVVAGDDDTEEIVRTKMDFHEEVEIVLEGERRGQSAAQNEIFKRASEDMLFMIDGDGLIKSGSLEALWEENDGNSILYGREIPETPDNLSGSIIDHFWIMHHELSLRQPKYTTQIALQPTDLINHIPKDIVIDDEYIGQRAVKNGLKIKYVPEAMKFHNIKGDLKSFRRHRRKNWAGMFQIQRDEDETLQSTGLKAKFYLKNLFTGGPTKLVYSLLLGIIEISSFIGGLKDAIKDDWPYKWKR